jgi:serine/threonine-protein kinase CTR1
MVRQFEIPQVDPQCQKLSSISWIAEYVEKGSLHEALHDPSEQMEWHLRLKIAQQTAAGVLYLHSRSTPIVHRDLKSENILLTSNYTVKICDFGLARLKTHSANIETRHANAGTPAWMAPEVLRGEAFNEKADVFSFGVVLWELLSRQEPWADKKPVQIMSLVGVMGKRLPLPMQSPHPECPPLFLQLIVDCWEANPRQRPDFWRLAEQLSFIKMNR